MVVKKTYSKKQTTRRSATKSANYNYKAGMAGTDQSQMNIKASFESGPLKFTTSETANPSQIISVIAEYMLQSHFSTRVSLYDQIKLQSCKCKVNLASYGDGFKATSSLTGVIVLDRNGVQYTDSNIDNLKLQQYSSAKKTALTAGSRNTMYHSVYASNMYEKSQYLPTEDLLDALYTYKQEIASETKKADAKKNFVNAISVVCGQWNPMFLYNCTLPGTGVTITDARAIIELDAVFQFRGPRNAQIPPAPTTSIAKIPVGYVHYGSDVKSLQQFIPIPSGGFDAQTDVTYLFFVRGDGFYTYGSATYTEAGKQLAGESGYYIQCENSDNGWFEFLNPNQEIICRGANGAYRVYNRYYNLIFDIVY